MKLAICQCDPGGTVNVQGPDYGANFARGAQVDLDAPVAPGHRVTWGAALGAYVSLFIPSEPEHATRAPKRRVDLVEVGE